MSTAALHAEFSRLHVELQALQSAAVKDMPRIDATIDSLEKLQLAIKQAETGVVGNNPNE